MGVILVMRFFFYASEGTLWLASAISKKSSRYSNDSEPTAYTINCRTLNGNNFHARYFDTGTLTLASANSYSAGTTISSGILLVRNANGSGTGAGAVNVNAGTLSGSGIIAGAVTVGTNGGTGAFLAPSKGVKKPATRTIQGAFTLNDDSTYIYKLDTKRAKADQVIANGVTIDNGPGFPCVQAGTTR